MSSVILVGTPNVGKSAIFNYLTGAYTTVSNYPGTTVDILRGRAKINKKSYEVIDTPGLYSLIPFTEEERVTRSLLEKEKADSVIHVIDTKNIRRMLGMTIQLIEAELPVILDLNVIDESKRLGVEINTSLLSEILGVPVATTSAIRKIGLDNLRNLIKNYKYNKPVVFNFSDNIEAAISNIITMIKHSYGFSLRTAAVLLISGDPIMHKRVEKEEQYFEILNEIKLLQECYQTSLNAVLALQRQEVVDRILNHVMTKQKQSNICFNEILGRYTREPLTGIPILCFVLYFGLYLIVGKFGAGFLVDYLDKNIFEVLISPTVEFYTNRYIEWDWLKSLIVGEYGIFSLGIRYAFVIILPIVGTFFLVFAILEDSGYLPRLAMLVDRVFKKFGLNGRAIIPITLGTGCGTMGVMVTRTLESKRERILATFLIALTVPCSAQLGVILSLLSHNDKSLSIWAAYIVCIFVLVGWISARILPGNISCFYMELPPLRLPLIANIVKKAWTRMFWYFFEILPVFILTSFVMWTLDYFGFLKNIIMNIGPIISMLGLPSDTAEAFLLGFFRRDYGAAGLYDLCSQGILSDNQLLVAAVTLTLFVPCVAQLAVMVKERGLVASAVMVLIIAGIAFLSGYFINWLLVANSIIL
ncbi:ferrous iron transport protein B [Dendrosporobacter sp. 1207_IL3150]|uniref:ferrous iron transport protein B n=1 Tax=Dendrosporobacter sp. 1207_IL3150 TaxID=3084054 RepID=UPI002FDAACD4